jgi:hypothetical protein
MQPKDAQLAQIQRWMQSVITHPGGVAEGLTSDAAREHLDVPADELESVIVPSRALDSASRLEIYVDAYHERLMECLRVEFEATRVAVGEDVFNALAFGYLQHYPSQSYTLNRLGERFARFLAESQLHAQAAPPEAGPTWPQFVVELAQLERLTRDVFDAVGVEGQPPFDAGRLAELSADEWNRVRLVTPACLRLARYDHPVHTFALAVREGETPVAPAPKATRLALNRRDYRVERFPQSAAQFELLSAVVAGSTLGESLRRLTEQSALVPDDLPLNLRRWFADWIRAGFFCDLEVVSAG